MAGPLDPSTVRDRSGLKAIGGVGSTMVSTLVAYGTGEGQTERVAERLADRLTERGHDATTANLSEETDLDPETYDAVLVGASIHGGRHQPAVREFVERHREALAARPTAFVQVSLSSATDDGASQAAEYVDSFLEETGWHPDRIATFGGALRYSQYGFLKRLVMKAIASRTISVDEDGGTVDAAGDVEFTDWDEVDAFAADVAAFVEGRLGVAAPGTDGDEVDGDA